jgi:DNA-binding NtrC family response regulator
VLQDKEIVRAAGRSIQVDLRCIAATTKNLEALVDAGTFRRDLYCRLHVFGIEVPPLRERKEDIPLLADHLLRQLCNNSNRPLPQISPEAMDQLIRYDWPGNVRELEHALERAIIVSRGTRLRCTDIALQSPNPPPSGGRTLEDVQRAHIEQVLRETNYNVSRTAQILGIDRTTLYNKLRRYGLR